MKDTNLARRARVCKHWRWMPGMLAQTPKGARVGRVVKRIRTGGVRLQRGGDVPLWCCPDLADPGTLGALLALVREAWGEPVIVVLPIIDPDGVVKWEYRYRHDEFMLPSGLRYASEAEALVLALERAR